MFRCGRFIVIVERQAQIVEGQVYNQWSRDGEQVMTMKTRNEGDLYPKDRTFWNCNMEEVVNATEGYREAMQSRTEARMKALLNLSAQSAVHRCK